MVLRETQEATVAERLDVSFAARHDRFDSEDGHWRGQVAVLLDEIRTETGTLERGQMAVPGTKGGVEVLILALGSAGAFTAVVGIIRAWLERDKHRSVELTFTDADGNSRTVQASAENAGSDVFAPLLANLGRDMAPEE
jgi:hypothetical protein